MRFTDDMIQVKKSYFTFQRPPVYWRFLVKDYDEKGNRLSIDFVKSYPSQNGYRVNIRILKPNESHWKSSGRPVIFNESRKVATCWINHATKKPETKNERKDNKKETTNELMDWRPFMLALHEVMTK